MFNMFDERTSQTIMLAMFNKQARRAILVWSLGRVGHFFLNPTHPLGPRRVGPGLRREPNPRVGFRRANAKNPS